MLTANPPLGVLRASESDYYDHTGIWIEFRWNGEDDVSQLVLVEYTDGKDDLPARNEAIITRVWKDPEDDKVTSVIHDNIALMTSDIDREQEDPRHERL